MENDIKKALNSALQEEAKRLAEKHVKDFESELTNRIVGLSLDVVKMVEVQTMNDRIILTIRKQ